MTSAATRSTNGRPDTSPDAAATTSRRPLRLEVGTTTFGTPHGRVRCRRVQGRARRRQLLHLQLLGRRRRQRRSGPRQARFGQRMELLDRQRQRHRDQCRKRELRLLLRVETDGTYYIRLTTATPAPGSRAPAATRSTCLRSIWQSRRSRSARSAQLGQRGQRAVRRQQRQRRRRLPTSISRRPARISASIRAT